MRPVSTQAQNILTWGSQFVFAGDHGITDTDLSVIHSRYRDHFVVSGRVIDRNVFIGHISAGGNDQDTLFIGKLDHVVNFLIVFRVTRADDDDVTAVLYGPVQTGEQVADTRPVTIFF